MAGGSVDRRKSRATTAGSIRRLHTSLKSLAGTMSKKMAEKVLSDSLTQVRQNKALSAIEKRLLTAVHQDVLGSLEAGKK